MVTDKSRLPFEVTRDEGKATAQQRQTQIGKKRIEVFVSPDKAVMVLSAIKKLNLEATVYDSKGYGMERHFVTAGGRGTGRIELPSTRHTVVTIIDSHRLKEVVAAIKATTDKHSPGGIIAISHIEDLVKM
jgi:nitrogen regulatory protein PII